MADPKIPMPEDSSFKGKPNEVLTAKAELFFRNMLDDDLVTDKEHVQKILEAIKEGRFEDLIHAEVENQNLDTGEVNIEEGEESPREWLESYIHQLEGQLEQLGEPEDPRLKERMVQVQELLDLMN